jgi:hypothetical protein
VADLWSEAKGKGSFHQNEFPIKRVFMDDNQKIAELAEAIRLNPNDATAYGNRGVAYANKRDYEKQEVCSNACCWALLRLAFMIWYGFIGTVGTDTPRRRY